MADEHHIRRELAQTCRFLAAHRLLDPWGHLSARIPDSDAFLCTPRFGARAHPLTVSESDLLVVGPSGRVLDGAYDLPLQFRLDVAVYAKHPAVGACVVSSANVVVAHGIVGRDLRPVLHSHTHLDGQVATLDYDGLILDDHAAVSYADRLTGKTACHQPGVSVIVVGTDLVDATSNAYDLEYLAQANLVAAGVPHVRTLDEQDIEALRGEISQAYLRTHHRELIARLDPGPQPHPWSTFLASKAAETPLEVLKVKLAFTARVLWERGTLVTYLEHVSHRAVDDNRWLMTATTAFSRMEPDDIVTLDYKANWIDGPKPPPFKWFHRDLLTARPDVNAIVHTHDLYGRMYALAGVGPLPIYRNGLRLAQETVAAYPKPSPVFREDVRRAVVNSLRTDSAVHELAHGTDFVGETLEDAAVLAIQREELLAVHSLALRLGSPNTLCEKTQADILRVGPDSRDWWSHYAGYVGRRYRSAGGVEWSV